jgi:uncharacterized protein YlxW (UPF0749 family)
MDLLNQIARSPYDPDYAIVAARDPAPLGRRWLVAVVAVLVGGMFALAAVQTSRRAPALVGERADLLARVQAAEADSDALRTRAAALGSEIGALRTAVTGANSSARSQQSAIEALEPASGAVAVRGPGLVIVVDDAPTETDQRANRVHDVDLQILANGLWLAGAEAVAINGHRLSALTAIRGAGEAITVDFRSLARPYRVEAIGDARTLEARFVESTGGVWWNQLAQNQGFGYKIQAADQLTLPADTGLRLRHARAVR